MSQSARAPLTKSDPIGTFLRELPERDRMPWLALSTGRIGIVIREQDHTERWTLSLMADHVDVGKVGGEADLTLVGPREVFNEIVTGRTHTLAAVLRSTLIMQGDRRELVFAFQRLLPSPEPVKEQRP